MTTKQKEDKISKFVASVAQLFDLDNYDKKIVFHKNDVEPLVCATMTTDNEYRRYTLSIYPEFHKESREEQCKTLLHELAHTKTHDLYMCYDRMLNGTFVTQNTADFHHERITENIAKLLFDIARGEKEFLKKAIEEYVSNK